MKKVYRYMNSETGEILIRKEMLEQWNEEYDGGDDTNPIGWEEYYEELKNPIVIEI